MSRYDSESFHICQRVLNQCHEMIYGDLPASGTPYSSLNLPTLPGFIRRKVKPNLQPALVGIGMILAGAPAMPALTDIMGEVAIEQGRLDDQGGDLRSLDIPDSIVRTKSDRSTASQDEKDDDDPMDPEEESRETEQASAGPSGGQVPISATRLSRKGGALSRRQTIAAQTSPALPLHFRDPRKSRLSEDPFGQNDPTPSAVVPSPSPFQSTPTFSQSRHFRRGNSIVSVDLLLQKYDLEAQKFLLRTHFCRSEVTTSKARVGYTYGQFQIQFLLALENICNRLLVVPKPARVSALRAELTGLNHMLPAEVNTLFYMPYRRLSLPWWRRCACLCGVHLLTNPTLRLGYPSRITA